MDSVYATLTHACCVAGSSSAFGTATHSCARAAAAQTQPRTARRRASGRPSRPRTRPRPRSARTGRASMQPAAAQAAKGAGASEVAHSRPCVGCQRGSCKVMHDSSPIANLRCTRLQARWVAGNGSEGLLGCHSRESGQVGVAASCSGTAVRSCCCSAVHFRTCGGEPVSVKPLPRGQIGSCSKELAPRTGRTVYITGAVTPVVQTSNCQLSTSS